MSGYYSCGHSTNHQSLAFKCDDCNYTQCSKCYYDELEISDHYTVCNGCRSTFCPEGNDTRYTCCILCGRCKKAITDYKAVVKERDELKEDKKRMEAKIERLKNKLKYRPPILGDEEIGGNGYEETRKHYVGLLDRTT